MRFLAIAPLAVLACLAASPLQAADEAPVVLEPSSQWVVDFAEDRCRLVRTFGPDDSRHVLIFEQGGPGRAFGLTAAGPGLVRFRSTRTSVRFGEFPPYLDKSSFTGTLGTFGAAIIWSNLAFAPIDDTAVDFPVFVPTLPEIDVEKAAKVSAISLQWGKSTLIFNTGTLGDAVKVLNQCAQDLLGSWGLDLERHRTAARLPVWTNESEIVRSMIAAYPEKALRKEAQAIIRMRIIVDEAGRVAECKLVDATAEDGLSSPACKVMQKAIFSPALDREGKPIRSFYLNNIVYRLN